MEELPPTVTGRGGRLTVRTYGHADSLATEAKELLEEARRLNRQLPFFGMVRCSPPAP